jgi:hypothetical protein
MRKDLTANQGVASVHVMPFQREDALEVPDQGFADPGHGSRPLSA